MAKSLYKGSRLGKLPPCLICMGPGGGDRAQLHLPGGVSVWLCAPHRSAEFQRRRGGRDLVASLMGAWRAAGCFTRARAAALDGHLARLAAPAQARPRPGSYAWPRLRAEAEDRFAAGERPAAVISALRGRHRDGPALAPSRRTMMRWFGEGRWLGDGVGRTGPAPRPSADPDRPRDDRRVPCPVVEVDADPVAPGAQPAERDGAEGAGLHLDAADGDRPARGRAEVDCRGQGARGAGVG